jgi:hypothetical protein
MKIGLKFKSLKFKPQDMWIGLYWDVERCWAPSCVWTLKLYICLVPMLPIKVTVER